MQIQRELTSKYTKYFFPSSTGAFLGYSWCGEFVCERNFYIKRTKPKFLLAIYTVSGEGELLLGKEKYTLSKGTLALLNEQEYSYYPRGCEWAFKFCHIHGESARLLTRATIEKRSPVFDFTDTEGCFDELMECARLKKAETEASIILYRLLSNAFFGKESERESEVIKRAKRYIENNLSGDLSVQKIASVCALSRPYFSAVFLKETGKSPALFVTEQRMKRAKELLCTTDESVTEIASKCGYIDASSFIRLFKRHEGVTPISIRKDKPLP